MTAITSDRADFYNFNPMNYLITYCNANGLVPANYYVESNQDGSTGLITFFIHPLADGQSNAIDTDIATPKIVNLSPGDSEVAAEVAVSS